MASEEIDYSLRQGNDLYVIKIKRKDRGLYNDGRKVLQTINKLKKAGVKPINRCAPEEFIPPCNSTMVGEGDNFDLINENPNDLSSPVKKRVRKGRHPLNEENEEGVSGLDHSFSELDAHLEDEPAPLEGKEEDVYGETTVHYLANELPFEPCKEKSTSPAADNKVVIGGLPQGFDEFILTKIIKSHLEKHGKMKPEEYLMMNVGKSDEVSKEVVVEFENEKIVNFVRALENVYYLVDKLTFDLHMKRATSPTADSWQVGVHGLPIGFEEWMLKELIKSHLDKQDKLQPNFFMVVGDFDKVTEKVFIEFEDEVIANTVANLENVHYLANELLFDPCKKKSTSPAADNKVVFGGLPQGFDEFILTKIIKSHLEKHGKMKPEEYLMMNVGMPDEVSKEVVVEFQNENISNSVKKLKNVYYMADKLFFNFDSNLTQSDSTSSESIFDNNEKVHLAVLDDSKKSNLAFFDACHKLCVSGGRRPFKATGKNLEELVRIMLDEHGIKTDVSELAKKKRNMDELHRRNAGSVWAKHLAYLRGEDEMYPVSASVELDSMEDDILRVTKFTNGATMSPAAIHSMLDVWKDLRKEFWAPHKKSSFYRKISAQMVLRGHTFSPQTWQNKMDSLVSDFKSYTKALKRTGQGAPKKWDFYEPLRPILESMVSVEPEQSYAVGAAVAATRNNLLATSGTSDARIGRERPPSKSESNRELLEMLVKSRKEMMDRMEKLAERRNSS